MTDSDVRHRLSVCLVALALGTAAPAWAGEPTAADRETARALMADGRAKRDAGDLAGALKAFQGADALMHVPTTAFEAAKTQAAMGLLVEARDAALAIARSEVKPGEPPPFAEARKNAATLAEELEAREASIKVTFAQPHADASVTVDGAELPAAVIDVPRKVNPGAHDVVIRVGGVERKVQVTVAERENVELPGEGAPVQDFLDTSSKPREGLGVRIPLNKALLYGGAGAAGAGLLVGTITGALSLSKTSDVKAQCAGVICPATTRSAIDSANALAVTADVAFVIGLLGAGAAGAGYYLILREQKAKVAALVPFVMPHGAGVSGTF